MKRTTTLGVIRIVIQIVSFILLPGLFMEAFVGLRTIGSAVAGATPVNADFWLQVMGTIITIVATVAVGRVFCGWMCAFGTMEDLLALLGKKVLKVRVKVDPRVDAVLKYAKYVILALIVGVVWTGIVSIPESWNPWEAFATLAAWPPDLATAAGSYLVGLVILLAIMVGSVFVERLFCRYLCPMGAVFGIASLLRFGRIEKPREACGKCHACTANCAMGIDLGKVDEVRSPDCIDCMRCVAVCPKHNADFAGVSDQVAPAVAGVAVASVLGLYYVGNLGLSAVSNASSGTISATPTAATATVSESVAAQTTPSTSQSASSAAATTTESSSAETSASATSSSAAAVETTTTSTQSSSGWADGTYTGSGTGHRGTTTVQVTISGGAITDIETVSTNDDAKYYDRAFSTVSSEIVSSQSTDVNAVSGATHSSDGIMEAVADALTNA